MSDTCDVCDFELAAEPVGEDGTDTRMFCPMCRIAALEAIVAKLPKTADGVPVVPGVELWTRPNRDGNCDIGRHWLLESDGTLWYGTMLSEPAGAAGSSLPIYNLDCRYSTREAAHRAAEPPGEADGH